MTYIDIGKIISTHGLKGEVRIESWSDFDKERYQKGQRLYVRQGNGYCPLTVRSYRANDGFPLVVFAEINDVDAARTIKDKILYIAAADRHKLKEGSYYRNELIGLKALSEKGDFIGTVIAVEETGGANTNLRIKRPEAAEALVPFVPLFIKEVDPVKGTVTVTPIEGLL